MQLKVDHINFIYNEGTAMESHALKDISFEIDSGEFVGIIGCTGSGKSTLIQHLNGLMKASSGKILFHEKDIYEKGFSMKELRQRVGLVFQYPEYQLFEVDVLTDVKFGPKNQGLDDQQAEARAKEALKLVGIDESYYKKSPFELSGGQKRRVAIAGVIAMRPEMLILDEPTAGLDPAGRDEILGNIRYIHEQTGMTVVLVSHSMEDVANYVSRLLVINHGELAYNDTPKEVFKHYKELEKIGLSAPQVTYVIQGLRERGFDLDENITTVAEAKAAILKLAGK